MKLSIIIPTRERIQYLRESVKTALAVDDPNVEIIVSDNASQDDTYEVLSKINDPRFKYVNTGQRVSMRANFENGLKHSTGDYIMFFGDDDGVLPRQIPILKKILSNENPDVLKWPLVRYGWPVDGNAKTGGVRFKKSSLFGSVDTINVTKLSQELVDCNLKSEEYYPALYHGVVSRSYLDSLKTSDGQFFNCTIPDIFFSYLSLLKGGKLMYCDHPFTLNGYSPASNGGSQKQIALGNEVPEIAAKFMAENAIDKNLDVADFGANIAAVFFLSLETARVIGGIDKARINYAAWFEFIVENAHKMTPKLRAELVQSLKQYAKSINKLDLLDTALKMPRKRHSKLAKLKSKIRENSLKIGSVRFSCDKGAQNTIFTAVQACDDLIGDDQDAVYTKTQSRKAAWNALKQRYYVL
ncbi:glycosyltransferase [Amylibacter sp. SFDW26]|uniref:glycosyltransferase family 2 protein n=1 Tax=Amylibacter sp. SFDW26 TaxID=2652722 RepID=UPI0012625EA0|nr:glycosyltransferase family 2 protein [Amylibacter sp. SFDW26]KAB7610069.1 glycosyltransferase [Amylibacter sp. SFDW26]